MENETSRHLNETGRYLVDEALARFHSLVSVPDPELDVVYATTRDALSAIGITDITPREAKVALSVLLMVQTRPQSVHWAIAAYLGTLIEEED